MASEVYSKAITKLYGETVSLTTTASHLLFRPDYQEVMLYCASQFRIGLAPRLAAVEYYSASGTSYTSYLTQAIDRDSATHVPLDAMATGDYLYLGFTEPVRGFHFTIDATNKNDNAATLDMEYMSAIAAGAATFTDVASDSDGTNVAGDTLKQSGLYAFTLPAVVQGIVTVLNSNEPLYWYRFCPSATLSATVDVTDITPACDTVNYGYMEAGVVHQFHLNTAKNGAFEFDHTGTGTLDVTWVRL